MRNRGVPLSGFTVPRPTFSRIEIVTPPAALPLDLTSLKAHLRITNTAEDTYLTELISVATESAERYLSRGLIDRTQRMWLDFPPGTGTRASPLDWESAQAPIGYANGGDFRGFELMGTPVHSVTSVKYITDAGVSQTMDPATYLVDAVDPDMPARIVLQRGACWPADLQVAHSISVEYVVGYGATAASVPSAIKHGVRLLAAALWSNRGDAADTPSDVLQFPGVKAILDPFRVRRFSTL